MGGAGVVALQPARPVRSHAPRAAADPALFLALVPILAVAAILRFGDLSSRGLLYWDEAKFALEGIRMMSVLESFPATHGADLAGKAIGTAKPTHALLIGLAYMLLGLHDYAPLYLDAAASVVAVAALAVLGTLLFDRAVGLAAAAFLAVSAYDIIYARSALSESDADLFFVLGVLCWWVAYTAFQRRGRRSFVLLFASGLLLGLSLTTNYRLIVYVAVIWITAGAIERRTSGTRVAAGRLTVLAGGILVLPVLWQVVGMVAVAHGTVLFSSEVGHGRMSYLAEFVYQLHGGKRGELQFDPLLYARWFVARQGWLLGVLLLAGLIATAIRRTVPYVVLSALVVVPFAVYSFAPFIVPRNLDASLPFTALLSAAGLWEMVQLAADRRIAQVAFWVGVALALALATSISYPLMSVRSGFVGANDYLTRHHIRQVLVDNEVMEFYLRRPDGGCGGIKFPDHPGAIRAVRRVGTAVISQYDTQAARRLLHHARRLARFFAMGPSYNGEDVIDSENGLAPRSPGPDWVDVYTLQGLTLPRHRGQPIHFTPCTLDRVV